MRRNGVKIKKPEIKRYDIAPDDEDGYVVKVRRPDGTSTVNQFRTVEEAHAWIEIQKRRDKDGVLTI